MVVVQQEDIEKFMKFLKIIKADFKNFKKEDTDFHEKICDVVIFYRREAIHMRCEKLVGTNYGELSSKEVIKCEEFFKNLDNLLGNYYWLSRNPDISLAWPKGYEELDIKAVFAKLLQRYHERQEQSQEQSQDVYMTPVEEVKDRHSSCRHHAGPIETSVQQVHAYAQTEQPRHDEHARKSRSESHPSRQTERDDAEVPELRQETMHRLEIEKDAALKEKQKLEDKLSDANQANLELAEKMMALQQMASIQEKQQTGEASHHDNIPLAVMEERMEFQRRDIHAKYEIYIKKLRGSLTAKKEEVQQLRAEVQEFKERDLNNISRDMMKAIERNEADLENVNRKNRPMKIAEEYYELCSNGWLDAKNALDSEFGEDQHEELKKKYLCQVFMVSLAHCTQLLERLKLTIALAMEVRMGDVRGVLLREKDEISSMESGRLKNGKNDGRNSGGLLNIDMTNMDKTKRATISAGCAGYNHEAYQDNGDQFRTFSQSMRNPHNGGEDGRTQAMGSNNDSQQWLLKSNKQQESVDAQSEGATRGAFSNETVQGWSNNQTAGATLQPIILSKMPLPQDVEDVVSAHLRENAESVSTKQLQISVTAIHHQVLQTLLLEDQQLLVADQFCTITDVQRFMEILGTFCWKMVTQKPPMKFETAGIGERYQGDKKQDVDYSSDNPHDPSNLVLYYVCPSLMHDVHMMAKGKVICGRKEDKNHTEA